MTLLPQTTPLDMTGLTITDFATRHFDPNFIGTSIPGNPGTFMDTLRSNPDLHISTHAHPEKPFLKTVIISNFTNCLAGTAEITDANKHLLRSTTEARREGEQPETKQYFQSIDVQPERAPFLHLIVYSTGQLAREGIRLDSSFHSGIVSINAEMVSRPIPPTPTAIERNEAGIEAGGNGALYSAFEKAQAAAYHARFASVR